jgi:hypothetical protein
MPSSVRRQDKQPRETRQRHQGDSSSFKQQWAVRPIKSAPKNVTTIAIMAIGCDATRNERPTTRTSSMRLNGMFETGSGDKFAPMRVAAFAPCDPKATPPPRRKAVMRTDGSNPAKAAAASTARPGRG